MADAPPTAAPFDIEQADSFYLGREYDQAARAVRPDKYVMYEARDLTTHGVVVGMTGSGKTGLCISLLEEAAIHGVPCVIIDPKGDLTNLLLQFPDLEPKHYREWLDEDEARRKGVSPEQYAEELSAPGAKGWRIRARRRSASPGSRRRRTSASTRPAANRGCRCRSSAPSPPRRSRCRARS